MDVVSHTCRSIMSFILLKFDFIAFGHTKNVRSVPWTQTAQVSLLNKLETSVSSWHTENLWTPKINVYQPFAKLLLTEFSSVNTYLYKHTRTHRFNKTLKSPLDHWKCNMVTMPICRVQHGKCQYCSITLIAILMIQ